MNKSHPSHPVYGDKGSSPRNSNKKKVNKSKQYSKDERAPSSAPPMSPNMAEGYMAPPTEAGGSLTVPKP